MKTFNDLNMKVKKPWKVSSEDLTLLVNDYIKSAPSSRTLPLANTHFGAMALGQQAGIWFGLSALTQIAFGDFRY